MGPQHRPVPCRRCRGSHPRIAHPPGWTEPLGRRTGNRGDSVIAALNLPVNLHRRTPEKIRMSFSVVPDDVSAVSDLSEQLSAFARETPDHKKSDACLIPF